MEDYSYKSYKVEDKSYKAEDKSYKVEEKPYKPYRESLLTFA